MLELNTGRHTLAHIMAEAVTEMFDGVKLGIGPAIDDGFYYDFDLAERLTQEHFEEIENRMRVILKKQLPMQCQTLPSKEEALALFAGEPYKQELIADLPEDAEITVYRTGDGGFFDLCRGPHAENTRELLPWAFKIHASAGAYWRGSEKNPMLQRLYAYAFPSKPELKSHIAAREEALKRDHNKLGRTLEFFTTSDVIGQGLPILLPKGTMVIRTLQRFVEDEEERRGYRQTMTPLMAKRDLYKISGHWDHYRDGMFVLGDPRHFDDEQEDVFAMRPMTCPFQFQAYLNKTRSYRDLPLRYNETSTLFRNESSGEMHGLIRVRQFTISEGHLACTPEQLGGEFAGCLDLAKYMLETLGLYEDVRFRFSKWDPQNRDKYIGEAEEWEAVQKVMREILDDLEIPYTEAEGEAAFYGPKLDIQIQNVFGKEDTMITIQIDFQLAGRFQMFYVDADGEKKNPYVIHRTSIGCYERTLALLIEKYAGNFPFWLSPLQIGLVPVRVQHNDYVRSVLESLQTEGFRCEALWEDESMGGKIKRFRLERVPYTLVMGDKEMENGTVSVRCRTGTQMADVPLADFIALCRRQNQTRALTLEETVPEEPK